VYLYIIIDVFDINLYKNVDNIGMKTLF